MKAYLYGVSRAMSRLLNTIIGGYSGETISGRCWRTNIYPAVMIIDYVWYLLGDGKDHCFRSYILDRDGGDHPDHYVILSGLGLVNFKSSEDGRRELEETITKNQSEDQFTLSELVDKITQWHKDRNLIDGSTDKDQFCKLVQEVGELCDNICKNKPIADDIGDAIVVLINIATRNKLTLSDCLSSAWDDIKDRKGLMIDGVFVKEADL